MCLYLTLFLCWACTSCSSVDGDEDAMKWETNAKIEREGFYSIVIIPTKGADYTFTCSNYRGFHFGTCKVNGKSVGEVENLEKIEGEWFSVENEGNMFRIVVQPNGSGESREIYLDVYSGNTGTLFVFRQV